MFLLIALSACLRQPADEDNDGVSAVEDCDDHDADVHPGAVEACNGVDDDCDGQVDGVNAVDVATWYADADADGYGDAAAPTVACPGLTGVVADATDCDDTHADAFPDAPELCDGYDNDCDGSTDESAVDRAHWYADADGDGYGNPTFYIIACEPEDGFLADATDCDDTDAAVNPAGTESCDDRDDDCDGEVDEAGATGETVWYIDGDADGYGTGGTTAVACAAPDGFAGDDTDCDDAAFDVNPGAPERCDNLDDDCDGEVDEPDAVDASPWYADADGDLYGDLATEVYACAAPAGHVADATDCDDAVVTVNPAAAETCDGLDDDCDGSVDEAAVDAPAWYADGDADSSGAGTAVYDCAAPVGYVASGADCDDADPYLYPGAPELCDTRANDCDTAGAWTDADEDGTASWEDTTGGWSEVATIVTGTAAAPAAWMAVEDGTLHLCRGTFYATLDVGSYAVSVFGVDRDETTLDAAGSGAVVSSAGDLVLEDLTVTQGNVGVYSDGGALVLTRVRVADNVSSSSGSAAYLTRGATLTATDSVFQGNVSAGGSPFLVADGSAVSLTACTVSTNSGLTSGGFEFAGSSNQLTFTVTDFSDNTPSDAYAAGTSYFFGAAATGACTEGGC